MGARFDSPDIILSGLARVRGKSKMKYIIPRNSLVPDPSFEDILLAGPKFSDEAGNPIGDRSTFYHGNDISFPRSAQLVEGLLYWYNEGAIYIPKFASASDQYLNFSKEMMKIGVTSVLGASVESILGEMPRSLQAGVHTGIEHILFPEREHAVTQLQEIVEDLRKKGTVYLPYVQLVEFEYQMVPPRFLRKAEHRFLFTYEKLNGERMTYGMLAQSSDPQDAFIAATIRARMGSEFGYLISAIKCEQVNTGQILAAAIEKYQSLYGEKLIEHRAEIRVEFQSRYEQELKQKGMTDQFLHATLLERIAPLLPAYRQLPQYDQALRYLEESAAGRGEAAAKATFKFGL